MTDSSVRRRLEFSLAKLMLNCRRLTFFCLLTQAWLGFTARAGDLSASDKFFLEGYEQLRAALAADDLTTANAVAEKLTSSGFEVPKSETLERARQAFVKPSEIAIRLTAGQPGYYVVHCPMLNKDWVQTTKQIGNPYAGKSMVDCGVIKGK